MLRESSVFENHPLDFDWRFSEDTTVYLARLLGGHGRLLLLGAPSIATLIRDMGARYLLVDRQPLHRVRVNSMLVADICERTSVRGEEAFDVVFLDPPWYVDHLFWWLYVASRSVAAGGVIWFSLWTKSTRSGADAEHERIFAILRSIGHIEIHEGVLRYETPKFEERTRTKNLERRGTLVRFQSTGSLESLVREPMVAVATWRRFTFGHRQVAIRVRTNGADSGALLQPVYRSGEWYQRSVSRRDRTRDSVDLWASNGFVAKVSSSDVFAAALSALSENVPSKDLPENVAAARYALLAAKFLPDDCSGGGLAWRHSEWMGRS